jgi:hypothetical protein
MPAFHALGLFLVKELVFSQYQIWDQLLVFCQALISFLAFPFQIYHLFNSLEFQFDMYQHPVTSICQLLCQQLSI